MRTDRRLANQFRARLVGRGRPYVAAAAAPAQGLADDLRIFILTFAGGFLFMTVYLA